MRRFVLLVTSIALVTGSVAAPAVGKGGGNPNAPDPNPNARIACENRGKGLPRFCVAPELAVTSTGMTQEQGAEFAAAFGLEDAFAAGDAMVDDGVFKFIDPERFQAVESIRTELPVGIPGEEGEAITGVDVLNLPALAQRIEDGPNVVGDEAATAFVSEALDTVGALPANAEASVTHSLLQIAHNESSGVPAFPGLEGASELLLDTQVSYNTVLDGVPVVGPGANVSVTLDAEGIVTQLQYAARGLGEGPGRPILDPASGEDVCRAALNLSSAAIVSAELVYYAPALSQDVGALLPHFACDSKQVDAAGNEAIGLTTYVPAVTDGPEASISNVSVDGGVKDGLVTASGSATGGAAGYVFSWSTTRGTIEEVSNTGTSTVTYEVVSKDPCATEVHETLILTVTDGDGLVSADRETFSVPVTPGDGCVQSSGAAERDGAGVPGATADTFGAKQMSHAVSGIQVGADGGTYSPDCTPYTTGWKNENSEGGVPSQFLYQANLAWSSDFKSDTITGGQDHEYADDVDMMFYCGHGSRGSFTFENTSGPTDKDITPGEARWGDRDIEWFALLSCQVLREDSIASGSGTWSVIWDESFNGLHGLYGFHTNASASGNLGYDMAKHMLGTDGVSAKTIHDAWVQAVNDGQPDGRIWATIYPVSTSSTWNRNDFFWGEGSVSADIPASNIYYFVRYQGTV